jgi:hypothetical protein
MAFSYSTRFERGTFDSFHRYELYMLEYLKRVDHMRPGETDGGGLVNFARFNHMPESGPAFDELVEATQSTVNIERDFLLLHEVAHALKKQCAGHVTAAVQQTREYGADAWAVRHSISALKVNPTKMMIPLFLYWYAGEAMHTLGDSEHPAASDRFRRALAVAVEEFKRQGTWREEYAQQFEYFNSFFDREAARIPAGPI